MQPWSRWNYVSVLFRSLETKVEVHPQWKLRGLRLEFKKGESYCHPLPTVRFWLIHLVSLTPSFNDQNQILPSPVPLPILHLYERYLLYWKAGDLGVSLISVLTSYVTLNKSGCSIASCNDNTWSLQSWESRTPACYISLTISKVDLILSGTFTILTGKMKKKKKV